MCTYMLMWLCALELCTYCISTLNIVQLDIEFIQLKKKKLWRIFWVDDLAQVFGDELSVDIRQILEVVMPGAFSEEGFGNQPPPFGNLFRFAMVFKKKKP